MTTPARRPRGLLLFALLLGCQKAPPPAPPGGDPQGSYDLALPPGVKLLRVYVAGESIERRNRYVAPPFQPGGALNERGGGAERNDSEEYGWAVPLGDRLRLRAPDLALEYVGADTWLDGDDQPYSGTYPPAPGRTSAISGTDIPAWLSARKEELSERRHCYEVAIAARGGNDLGNDDDDDYKTQLKALLQGLASGSSCHPSPLVYVTAHLPDDRRGDGLAEAEIVRQQKERFVARTAAAVSELRAAAPALRLRLVDLYTPFVTNRPTTAFPAETWSRGGVPDWDKIARTGDALHPRRLASIYAGEVLADALDLAELRAF